MAKLIDEGGRQKVGRDGLLRFIDELNDNRARVGERARYKPQENERGELEMASTRINPGDQPTAPSPRYYRE